MPCEYHTGTLTVYICAENILGIGYHYQSSKKKSINFAEHSYQPNWFKQFNKSTNYIILVGEGIIAATVAVAVVVAEAVAAATATAVAVAVTEAVAVTVAVAIILTIVVLLAVTVAVVVE